MSEYSVDTLANGARVVVVSMPHLHSAELVCYLAVGGRCEKEEQNGISHFLEHMLFRGTVEYPSSTELERAFEKIGGAVNASTDAETTCFHSRIHPDYVDQGMALFASMLRQPKFNDIDIERRIILEEAREDYNEDGVQINPDNLMVGLFWPDHPLGRPLAGTPDILRHIDRQALETYHRLWYQPENLVVCACGKLTRDSVLEAVEKQLGDWQGTASKAFVVAPAILTAEPESLWVQDSDSQITLQLAFPLPGRNDPEILAVRVLRRILSWGGGARLTLRLREELGLTYAVDANCSLFNDTGYLVIDLAVAPVNLVRAVAELFKVIKDLREQPVATDEFQTVINSYLFDLDFSRDQTEAMAVRYGWGTQAGYLRTLEQDRRELRSLSPDRLCRTAQRFFRRSGLKLLVIGPWREAQRREVQTLLRDCPLP